MKICGFWPLVESPTHTSKFTPFSVAGLIDYIRSENTKQTSDLIFIEPDPFYWEEELTSDARAFIKESIWAQYPTDRRPNEEQIVQLFHGKLFPGQSHSLNAPPGIDAVLREWLLERVFGGFYSSILGPGQVLVFSYPAGELTSRQRSNIQRLIWLFSENLMVYPCPSPCPAQDSREAFDLLKNQIEPLRIRDEVVMLVSQLAKHESSLGVCSFSLELEGIPDFRPSQAEEFDSRFGGLDYGPRSVASTILNRSKSGAPVSRSYFFPSHSAMVFLNALDIDGCVKAFLESDDVPPSSSHSGDMLTPVVSPNFNCSPDEHPERQNIQVNTYLSIANESHASSQSAASQDFPRVDARSHAVEDPVFHDQSIVPGEDSSTPEPAITPSVAECSEIPDSESNVVLKFLSSEAGDLKRNQEVLIEFFDYKIAMGDKMAVYLLCFCLAATFDDGVILNNGNTRAGLDLSQILAGSDGFGVNRLTKVCTDIRGAFTRGLKNVGENEKITDLELRGFECDGQQIRVKNLLHPTGDEGTETRGRQFILEGCHIDYSDVCKIPKIRSRSEALIEKFKAHYGGVK